MRSTLPFLLTIVLASSLPAAAQTNPAQRWVAEADRLQSTDAAATFRLAQQAIPRLRAPSDVKTRMKALELRCWAAAEVAPDSLIAFAEAGVADAARSRDDDALGQLRVCRGYGHEQAGRQQEAMRDYDFGAAAGERLGDRDLRASALVLRGELRYHRGEFTTALADLDTAYRLFAALGDRRHQRYTLNAIANLYADSRVAEYDRALEYYRQVLVADQAAGSKQGIATGYFNLGATLEQKGKLEEALAQYRRGLAMDQERGDAEEVATDQRAIAVVLYKLGRPAEALAILDRALAWFRKTGNEETIAQARLSRGVALRMLGR
ncbi:MAG: tetratricopeptide repeat protein, partial [Gemmatimonadetes bacterium]|nr:tetratricopeptide repeat protein [Gemmatimonadota bacterium]